MPKYLPALFILSLITCCIEIDISVPSFPDISDYFDASDGIVQLIIATNFLGFCLASLVYGSLSECYGRRPIMLIGNGIMSMGAIFCVISNSIETLLVARFIQGLGASTSAVVVFVMVADVYKGNKAIRVVGVMNAIFSTAMALAPVIGCVLNQALGWRGNYSFVAILTLIAWVSLILLLPETLEKKGKFSLNKAIQDFKILMSSKVFVCMSIVPSLLYAIYLSFIGCAPFLYMQTYRLSLFEYGLHQVIIVGCFAITSVLTDKVMQYLGKQRMVSVGFTLSAVSLFVFAVLASEVPSYLMTILMSIFSIGFALAYPVIFTRSMEIYPNLKGVASSMIMSMRAIICAGCVAITGLMYDGSIETIAYTLLAYIIIMLNLVTFKAINYA